MMLAMEDDEMEAKDELDELYFEDDEDEFARRKSNNVDFIIGNR